MSYYDRQGRPMTLLDWARAFEGGADAREAARRVAQDDVGDGVWVSTVWLGLDHSFGSGPPLIFETLVFGGPLDGEMDRYATEAEARAGHEAMVARCRAMQPPEPPTRAPTAVRPTRKIDVDDD